MEKKKIAKVVGHSLSVDTCYRSVDDLFSIDELQQFLTESKNRGADCIKITGDYYDEDLDSIDIHPIQVTLESDEDYEKRLAEIESKRLAKENVEKAKEKALYEELKLKYE